MGQESKFCLDLNPFHLVSLRIGEFVAFNLLAKRSLILRQVFLLVEKQNQTSLLADVSHARQKYSPRRERPLLAGKNQTWTAVQHFTSHIFCEKSSTWLKLIQALLKLIVGKAWIFFSIMSEFLCENDGPKPPWGYTTLIINCMYIIFHRRSVYWDNNFAKDWDNIEPTKSGM